MPPDPTTTQDLLAWIDVHQGRIRATLARRFSVPPSAEDAVRDRRLLEYIRAEFLRLDSIVEAAASRAVPDPTGPDANGRRP